MIDVLFIIICLLLIFLFLSVILNFIFIVKQQTAIIIERLGKFSSIRYAGLYYKLPIIDNIVGKVSLKIQQLDVVIETKTQDNVFLKLKVSLQFKVIKNKVYEAFYKLDNPKIQINAYIFDVVRAQIPKMKLDDVFEKKDDIALVLKSELSEAMNNYGYSIIKALVTDIDPDETVKQAMNRINTSEREKVAAEYEAEAERIKIVAKAKAEAESKRLQGKGIADQRREIAQGLLESVERLNNVGIKSQEASALIVVTQHYDTLQYIGERSGTNLILLPNTPGAASDMLSNMIASFHASSQINETIKNKNSLKKYIKNKNNNNI